MDQFFQHDHLADIFLDDIIPLPLVNQSAFVPYTEAPFEPFRLEGHALASRAPCKNFNRRMIEFLRRNWASSIQDPERERGFKHMMSERMRRERQKQSFTALHSILPRGTKNDKNSIIKMAAKNIQELEIYKEELQRRKQELETSLGKLEEERYKGTKISVQMPNAVFPISSMIEALKCLKNVEANTISIQSSFTDHDLVAVFGIESKVEATEIKRTVEETLLEAEKKLLDLPMPLSGRQAFEQYSKT